MRIAATTGLVVLFFGSLLYADDPVGYSSQKEFFRAIAQKYADGFVDNHFKDEEVKKVFWHSDSDDLLFKLAVESVWAIPRPKHGQFILVQPNYYVGEDNRNLLQDENEAKDFYLAKSAQTGISLLGRMHLYNSCYVSIDEKTNVNCSCTRRDGNNEYRDSYQWNGTTFVKTDSKWSVAPR